MDFFQIVAYNEPEKALAIFREHSRIRVTDQDQLAIGLKKVYKNLRAEDKETFLLELTELHPDQKLFKELYENEFQELNDNVWGSNCSCPNCQHARSMQTHFGANGLNAVGSFMGYGATGVINGDQSVKSEIDQIKTENNIRKTLNDQIFKIAVVIGIGFLVYKIYK